MIIPVSGKGTVFFLDSQITERGETSKPQIYSHQLLTNTPIKTFIQTTHIVLWLKVTKLSLCEVDDMTISISMGINDLVMIMRQVGLQRDRDTLRYSTHRNENSERHTKTDRHRHLQDIQYITHSDLPSFISFRNYSALCCQLRNNMNDFETYGIYIY